jgi:hypothetical protein
MTHTRESIISLAMACLNWPRARATSWYTQENRWFNTNSPRELVQRGEGQTVIDFLEARRIIRESKEPNESNETP